MQFVLRPFSKDDLASLLRYANDPIVAGNLMDPFPYPFNEHDGITFIERFMKPDPARVFTIAMYGEVVVLSVFIRKMMCIDEMRNWGIGSVRRSAEKGS